MLSLNLESIKSQKLSSILIMVSMYAVPLLIAAFLYNQDAAVFTPYSLFLIAVFFFITILLFTNNNETKSNGFSVPTISDYPTIQEAPPLPGVPRSWSIRLIKEMEWKKFEELCLGYFLLKGVKAKLISKGTNGFIELRLDNASQVNAIVQHKTSKKDIGVKELKSLLALLEKSKITKGFYMTAGSFSDEAKALAKESKITLISGGMLLTMIKRLQENLQEKLLSNATEGDYKTPTCPACNVKMISRLGPHQNKYFWGCVNKPKCRHIMPRQAQRVMPRKGQRSPAKVEQYVYS